MDCAFRECSIVWFCSVRVLFCFGSFAVCTLHYNLSHFKRSIYNKNMGKFASLLISARCAISCVPANKMDVDWVDFIRKNFQNHVSIMPLDSPSRILSSEPVDSENHNTYYALISGTATASCCWKHHFFPPTVVKMKKIDYQYTQVCIRYNLFCHASSASHPTV